MGGGKEPQGIGGINGENIGRRGPGGGGSNLGDLIPGGGGRILGNIPGGGTGIPRGLNMSGGGGARRPISGGGFIVLPRPFPFGTPNALLPRPRTRPIRLLTPKNQNSSPSTKWQIFIGVQIGRAHV